ncbi:hypothetical protein [Nodularia sp. NIES-3585]|nr:hypothetical protein [Nodularia sp. NIES-3585]
MSRNFFSLWLHEKLCVFNLSKFLYFNECDRLIIRHMIVGAIA